MDPDVSQTPRPKRIGDARFPPFRLDHLTHRVTWPVKPESSPHSHKTVGGWRQIARVAASHHETDRLFTAMPDVDINEGPRRVYALGPRPRPRPSIDRKRARPPLGSTLITLQPNNLRLQCSALPQVAQLEAVDIRAAFPTSRPHSTAKPRADKFRPGCRSTASPARKKNLGREPKGLSWPDSRRASRVALC
jgi:hypothetical protein